MKKFSDLVSNAYKEAHGMNRREWSFIQSLVDQQIAELPVEEREALQTCFKMMATLPETETSLRRKQ